MPSPLARSLAGVRVVALEQAVSMPFCSFILAEMGADVVKIERPGAGDVVRGWDRVVRGLSTGFVWVNANKRDITVDLSDPDGQGVVRDLAEQADVFVENFAPGVAARLGLGPDRLRNGNEGLVYCSLSGYGQTGPYRDVKAYDLLVQGESGILLTNGYPDAPAKIGLPITDLIGGMTAAMAIVAALYERRSTGVGADLDIGMLEATVPWLGYYPQRWWHEGAEPPRSGMRHQYLCPYGPYECADGRYVNLVVASADHWKRFAELVVRRPEWLDDPRFADVDARSAHREEVEAAVEAEIAAAPLATWLERLREAGLPFGEVRTIEEVLQHPQLLARRMFVEADSPVGPLDLVRFPLGDADRPRRIPGLGEHTDEVLSRDLGYDAERIRGLRARGVV